MKAKASHCRDWRNRRLAHTDLALATNKSATTLAAASRATIREAIEAISEVVKTVHRHFMDSTLDFSPHKGDDAVELLHVINDGLQAAQEGANRIASRRARPEDYGAIEL
jgi:pyocin large subunit-like protein